MKLIKFLGALALLYTIQCHATAQEAFLQANEAYNNNDFSRAVQLYQSIDNKGAAVWYNLGNCWYHMQRYPDALACWKRALRCGGASWYDDITKNCNHVEQILGLQCQETMRDTITVKIKSYSLLFWQMLLLILMSITCILMFVITHAKMRLWCGLLSIVCSLLTSFCLILKYWTVEQKSLIIAQECYLIAGTDERFSKIALLKSGRELAVVQAENEWIKVQGDEGTGWVLTDNCIYV